MRRVALIQNESEMMRYSWADIRPMFSRLPYAFDAFTAENVNDVYAKLRLRTYDALVIASNACNDKVVRESLQDNRQTIEDFLRTGRGLFISFQMKMADFDSYQFLPDRFRVSATNRIYAGENPRDGELNIGRGQESHTVLRYPTKVALQQIRHRCLTNNLVEGLYWIYLKPEDPQSYVTLVEDLSYTTPRSLLISSRADYPFRIVVSALAVDWQLHNELWENAIRYVVEGRPSIAVVQKSGSSLFDFRFLISTLEIGKLSSAEYVQESLNPQKIPLDVHDTYIFDPAWSPAEVANFVEACSSQIDAGQARVFFFGEPLKGRPVLQAISNVREYQIIARNAITWLISQFPDDENQGYWAGSFWCTVDALFALLDFGVSVERFKDRVLKAVGKHDRNGSYDEVLGATCAMLEIYNLFYGKDHDKTLRTLRWIREHMHEKTLFEQGTAYDVLSRLKVELPERNIVAFKSEVTDILSSLNNEFMIYRFGRTLLSLGFVKEAEQVALRLRDLQSQEDGKWVNIPNTAVLVELLIDICNVSQTCRPVADEMIFRAVQFIRSMYSPAEFSWKSDVSSTAKSLKALRAFERRISFPIDVLTAAVEAGDTRARNYIAIEAASTLNVKLQEQANDLNKRIAQMHQDMENQRKQGAFSTRLSSVLTVIVSLLVSFSLLFTGYLVKKDLFTFFYNITVMFLSDSMIYLAPVLVVVTCVSLVYVLRRLGKLPQWFAYATAPFTKIKVEEENKK